MTGTDRGFINISSTNVVFGDVCDSCGQLQTFRHSKGLKKLEDVGGDWLLCSECHPSFEDEMNDED